MLGQVLLGVLCCMMSIVRTAGPKGVLITGLLVTLIYPLLYLSRPRPSESPPLWTRLSLFLGMGLIPWSMALACAALLTRGCEIGQGLAMVLLGHLPGLLVTFGAIELLEATLPRAARWVWPLVWMSLTAFGGYWFLYQPVYRVAHPLAGMMLGPPNESQEVLTGLTAWFALEMVGWAVTLTALAALARFGWRRLRWGWAPLGVGAMTTALLVVQSPELGYRINESRMDRTLSVTHKGAGITHHMSPLIPTDALPWLQLEAEFQRDRQRQLLGLKPDELPPAAIFWFRDDDEKQALTGARRTKFAKVHIGQIYVSADEFPPRTVGHELAHVTSGRFNHNPLRVPGHLGGAWYNPALVEGFAVAVAWDTFPLSPHEQAAVALAADKIPPLADLFSPLGFATTNLNVAYRASGSFMRFCIDRYGLDKTLTWYETEDFKGAFGLSLRTAEKAWREYLRAVPIRPQDRQQVESAQSRPSIGEESCQRSEEDQRLSRAIRAEADAEVDRLVRAQGDPNEDPALWLVLRQYEAERTNYRCDLPTEPPMKLGARNQRRYRWIRALTLWAARRQADAEAILSALPEEQRSSGEVINARIMLRDGYSVDDYAPDAPVDVLTHRLDLFHRDHHPLLGYLVAETFWEQQRWDSLAELVAQLTWDGFIFPDDLDGTYRVGLWQMRGLAAFARRDWDAAIKAWDTYLTLVPTEGRRAFGETWRARAVFFKAHAGRLKANLPRL